MKKIRKEGRANREVSLVNIVEIILDIWISSPSCTLDFAIRFVKIFKHEVQQI